MLFQNRPGGWGGGDSNQWNAAVGGPKPKPPSTSSWGDEWNPTDRKVRMGPVVGGMGGAQPPSNLGTDRDMYWNNPPQQGNKPTATFNWGEKDMVWNTSDYNKVMIVKIMTFNVHMLNSDFNILGVKHEGSKLTTACLLHVTPLTLTQEIFNLFTKPGEG